jgi:predicted DCC family thiol-disulfide oxidoreductase YuxK
MKKVHTPPEKAIVIYDGDCAFCKEWVCRWKQWEQNAFTFEPYQSAWQRFPEIGREEFARAVYFINTEGNAYHGADAVYQACRVAKRWQWYGWMYSHVPGFATLARWGYGIIARNRGLAYRLMSLLGLLRCK